MLKNYLKIAWRNLWKDKFYSGINILGLAVSTAAFLLIINFVRFEYSYENFHEKADDIYRVTVDYYKGAEFVDSDAETPPALGPVLEREIPEVLDYVRVQMMEEIREVSYRNEGFRIDRVYAADPSLFSVFNYDFIEGDPQTALNDPTATVITETQANRLFGTTKALGKDLRAGGQLFRVTGILKDAPLNTHLKVDMLIPFAALKNWGYDLGHWDARNNYTYLHVVSNTSGEELNNKFEILLKEHFREGEDILVAQPIKDIHLHSHKTYEPEVNGDAKTVQFLLVVAILIILVGSANYMNLTTARATERTKEAGMRKTLGSSRFMLIKQFITETFLINLLALGVALLIVKLSLPAYFSLIARPMTPDFFSSSGFWTICTALFVLNCLLSGFYPSLVLSSVKPASVTARAFTSSAGGNALRRALVVGQFAVALIVLSASFIVYKQLSFLRGYDLGMNTEEVLVISSPSVEGSDSTLLARSKAFTNSLLQLPGVDKVAVSGAVPGLSYHEFSSLGGFSRYGSEEGKGNTYRLYGIDADFIPLMEMKLLAGRNFQAGSTNKDELIISRAAARLLGFDQPETAVGARISGWGSTGYSTVIGVIENYHQRSLKEPVHPMIHPYNEINDYFTVKLKTADMQKAITSIQHIWKDQFPTHPFQYYFLNEMFNQQYKADQQFGKIVGVFSGLTLFITCLGLLGLTAYSVSRRAKEIGVRKVLGASVSSVVTLLTRDFVKLVLIAIVVATPIAWYAMNRWLEDFAYRTELQWWMFALVGLLVVFIALLTVSWQSVKAALANPVKSLRSE